MILVCPRGSVRVTYNRAVCQILLTTSVESVMKKYMCLICGWIYDEETGWPEDGIAAGTKWDDVPMNWTCPECGARKDDFEMVEI